LRFVNFSIIVKFFFSPISFLVNSLLEKRNFLLLYNSGEAIGDNICVTNLINSINKKFNYKIYLFTLVPEVYENNNKIYKNLNIKSYFFIYIIFKTLEGSNIIQLGTKTYPYNNLHDFLKNSKDKTNCKHLVEYLGGVFFKKKKLKIEKNEIFFSSEELTYFKNKFPFYDKKFAIINPVSKKTYTTVKSWGFEKYQKLVNSHDIMWIQVGMIKDPILKNALNLNGKTTLREFFFLVKSSFFVIGDEGSLNHIAACFDKKSFVVMSGFTPSKLISYSNTTVISRNPNIECSPCYLVKKNCFREKKFCTEDIKVNQVLQCIFNFDKKIKK
jgi:ADP-heptose:LPS heptosyltransferase